MDNLNFKQWVGNNPSPNPATDRTVINHKGSTVDANNDTPINQQNNPEVIRTTSNLKQIQNQLSNIHRKISDKPIWTNTKMKQAFKDRIISGWEKVGQAHAILTPQSNRGNDI